METKIFHGDPKMVQTEMNDFLKQGGINLIDVQMSTCSIGQAVSQFSNNCSYFCLKGENKEWSIKDISISKDLALPEVEGILDGECFIYPKIDGTNGQAYCLDGKIYVGSRKRFITPEDDNAGCAKSNS